MLPDRFQQLRESFTKLRLVVVGDVMLDTYYWGGVARISPEAPVPIVSVDRLEHRPGGAANVAYNLISLGAKADLAGVVGSDTAGSQLEAALATYGIPATLLTDPQRPTTHKIRIIADSQHVARLDEETEQWLEESRRCFDWFLGRNRLKKPLYDYETGGCRDALQPGGVNENEGAESTLAWLLSLLAIRSLEPASQEAKPRVPVEASVEAIC